MKASKSLYSTCFEEYRLNDETLKRLQHELFEMFLDVKSVCDENGIDYMLAYGSALGAVRHQGFIPWDDDIDIIMRRSEFERFAEKFNSVFSDKYLIAQPLSDRRYVSKLVKIYKRGTTYVEIPTAGVGGKDMLFIDLFLIENVPAPGLYRKLKALLYNTAFRAASVCIDYQFPSPVIEKKAKEIPELDAYYTFRKRLGSIFAHLGGIRFYLRICERLASQKKKTGWMGVVSGINYEREIYPEKFYTETTTKSFCGVACKIPADYDTYLKNLYGDYMKLPPEDKREYHAAYKIEF